MKNPMQTHMNGAKSAKDRVKNPPAPGVQPQQHDDQRNMDRDKRRTPRFVVKQVEDRQQPPLAMRHGVEFMSHDERERQSEQELPHRRFSPQSMPKNSSSVELDATTSDIMKL
jgi:hypothetical protein